MATDEQGREILQAWNVDWSVPGGQLVIVNEGVTTRVAAGELTEQLIPALAIPHLEGELRTCVEAVNEIFGMKGLTVVALAGVEGDVHEGMHEVQS